MKDQSRFWDRIADKYYRSPIKDNEAYQHKLAVSRTFLHPDATVLEFGCGTGGTAISHARHVKHVHAIDISGKMLAHAREQASKQNVSNVTFEQAGIESFSATPNYYDVIFGMSILHLVENRKIVLDKVYRMLKPGGVFISSTACMGDSIPIFKYIVPVGRALGLFPIVKVFGQTTLVNEMSESEFHVVQQWRPNKKMAAFVIAEKKDSQFDDILDHKIVCNTDLFGKSTEFLHALDQS